MRFLLLGNPENRRVSYFQEACQKLGLAKPKVLAWESFLRHPETLLESLHDCDALRIESPGENYSVFQLLIQQEGRSCFSREEYHRGRIGLSNTWYRGWLKALTSISSLLPVSFPVMNDPSEIALLFDKYKCQLHLAQHNLPTPKILGRVQDSRDVFHLMEKHNCSRVFIKPSHNSSASGVIALEKSRHRIHATTSVKLLNGKIYNSLAMQHYQTREKITAVLHHLKSENLFIEKWFPKLTYQGRSTDFRVLMIKGSPAHTVARTSKSPITNLHLNNQRGDISSLKKSLGTQLWSQAMEICEQVASLFPKSHYLAIDLAVGVNKKTIKILETNAFGDLLPNLHYQEMSTYEAELVNWISLK